MVRINPRVVMAVLSALAVASRQAQVTERAAMIGWITAFRRMRRTR